MLGAPHFSVRDKAAYVNVNQFAENFHGPNGNSGPIHRLSGRKEFEMTEKFSSESLKDKPRHQSLLEKFSSEVPPLRSTSEKDEPITSADDFWARLGL
jgi:hypothetical protein